MEALPQGAAETAVIALEPPVLMIGCPGRKGAKWDLHEIGPTPGPPPPWGMENV